MYIYIRISKQKTLNRTVNRTVWSLEFRGLGLLQSDKPYGRPINTKMKVKKLVNRTPSIAALIMK